MNFIPSPKPLHELINKWGLEPNEIYPIGPYYAKLNFSALDRLLLQEKRGRYILVTATNPTPFGEGKTTTSLSLAMALGKLGKRAFANLRQGSLGPTFGSKGAAIGGGMARVIPDADVQMHFTGDMHSITQAHNQIAAILDNALFFNQIENLRPDGILWGRVSDVNDRFLRHIRLALGIKNDELSYSSAFQITPASEIMACLTLASGRDLKSYIADLRNRLGNIVIAKDSTGKFITVKDINAVGAALAILRWALVPNLAQSAEGTPIFIHGGPFANIAHGCSSIIADQLAIRNSDYVITEAGFGADLGGEKFFNIKCRASGLVPHAIVLVTTLRALKYHSGFYHGQPISTVKDIIINPNENSLNKGLQNLLAHLNILKPFGPPIIVAINEFPQDTQHELELTKTYALAHGAHAACSHRGFAEGGEGAKELALLVEKHASFSGSITHSYEPNTSIKEKIRILAKRIYGAKDINLSPQAEAKLNEFAMHGFTNLAICTAKSPLSLKHSPTQTNENDQEYVFPVADAELCAGAGFVRILADKVETMPGLVRVPKAYQFDISDTGELISP